VKKESVTADGAVERVRVRRQLANVKKLRIKVPATPIAPADEVIESGRRDGRGPELVPAQLTYAECCDAQAVAALGHERRFRRTVTTP
jgi:hypothetical protein